MSRLDPIREAEAARVLRESLAAVDAEDDVLMLDLVEGETGLFEAVDALLNRIGENRAMVVGTDAQMVDLGERKRRFEARIDADRALLEQAMLVELAFHIGKGELPKLERPGATLSLTTRAAKVEVAVEADIPAEFWRVGEPKLDKKAVGDALKAGRAVPGACLSNAAPTLTVRTK